MLVYMFLRRGNDFLWSLFQKDDNDGMGWIRSEYFYVREKIKNKNESFNQKSNILGYAGMSFEEEHVFFSFTL